MGYTDDGNNNNYNNNQPPSIFDSKESDINKILNTIETNIEISSNNPKQPLLISENQSNKVYIQPNNQSTITEGQIRVPSNIYSKPESTPITLMNSKYSNNSSSSNNNINNNNNNNFNFNGSNNSYNNNNNNINNSNNYYNTFGNNENYSELGYRYDSIDYRRNSEDNLKKNKLFSQLGCCAIIFGILIILLLIALSAWVKLGS